MARPLSFDRTDVIDRALLAFWQRGFDGCSIADLTQACGINRQSLYNLFTDKQGAFQAVLARYIERLDLALAPLMADGTTLADIRGFMTDSLALQDQVNSGACLLVITAFSPHQQDPALRALIEQGAGRTRAAFAHSLAPHSATPDADAAYLFAMLTGISALSRTGGSAAMIDATLTHTFSSITR